MNFLSAAIFLVLHILVITKNAANKGIKQLRIHIQRFSLGRAAGISYIFFTARSTKRKINKWQKKRHRTHHAGNLTWAIKLKYFIIGTMFSFIFIFFPIITIIIAQQLPDPNTLTTAPLAQTTKIYDRRNTLLYEIYTNQNRTLVPLADVPKYLQNATIAIEDKNFYKNPGFDIIAIIRAALTDISGNDLQGGSTITQQLIKSSLLTPQRSIGRKIQEIILAFWAEKIYTKHQILQMYFNQVPYGGTSWGIEAAAETYFGKRVKDLDLSQSAFLAGLPRAPTIYSPFGATPRAWKKRQWEVLKHMQQLGYISQKQEQQAEQESLTFQGQQMPLKAPHFSMYIKDLLIQKYGEPTVEKGGLNVITSLDLTIQDMAQKIVTDEVSKDGYLNLTNGAALITNPGNGDILAMVGSKDYNDPNGGNNNVTLSTRQPGSSIKIITYSAALSRGMTAANLIDDIPTTFPGNPPYSPVNYDGQFRGRVTLRTALANSFNIPAVKTLNAIGIPAFVSLAQQMGLTGVKDDGQHGLSMTLGAVNTNMMQMTTAYGTLANGGKRVDVNPILKVTDGKGHVLEEKQVQQKPVLDKRIAFIISDILADNSARSREFGANSPLLIPNHYVSVKTGTTDDKRDNWTFGYTSDFVAAVWVGNNDNSPMSQSLASGITGAAPIWHDIMTILVTAKPEQKPATPSNVIQKTCNGKPEYFVAGTENSVNCGNQIPFPTFFFQFPNDLPYFFKKRHEFSF